MTPKEEIEGMTDALIGRAEELLVEHGEFHPFGAVLDGAAQVQQVAPAPQNVKNPADVDIVGWVADALHTRAKGSDQVRAACIVSLVAVERPGTGETVDAIRMAVDHREGYVAHLFFPYQLEASAKKTPDSAERQLVLGEPFAARGVSYAFRGERYAC